MFVGHYSASLALKGFERKASLGLLFLAVQFVDILFFPFVLLGIERINIIEDFTQSTHFELEYMPYTHSMLASFLCAGIFYTAYRIINPRNKSVAFVTSIAVLSHWYLDLIVHTPDLPLWSDASNKLGLGLWNNAIATYALEGALLVAGLYVYLRSTQATSLIGRYGMVVLIMILLLVNVVNVFGPPFGTSTVSLAVSAMAMYFIFAGVAHLLDECRPGAG